MSEHDIPAHLLPRFLAISAELCGLEVLIRTGKLKPYLKKSEAFRRFGRKHVEHWINNGWLTIRKDGGHSAAWRIDRLEIETVAKAREMLRYL
ncbi:MAG: hypothetical protein JSU01_05510 [Bacteroidetes bacterium]|nr:hypothetical protein [Bacteroidota bacterium]